MKERTDATREMRIINMQDELYLLAHGKKLITETAQELAQTPHFNILNAQLKLPARTIVNLISMAIMQELTKSESVEQKLLLNFEQQLQNLTIQNPKAVTRETLEYIATKLTAESASAQRRWADFIASAPVPASIGIGMEQEERVSEMKKESKGNSAYELLVEEKCRCGKKGWRAVRYADVGNPKHRVLQVGVSHDVANATRGKFHNTQPRQTITLEQAKRICKEIHQKEIVSPASAQISVTGIVDYIPDPPATRTPRRKKAAGGNSPQDPPVPSEVTVGPEIVSAEIVDRQQEQKHEHIGEATTG